MEGIKGKHSKLITTIKSNNYLLQGINNNNQKKHNYYELPQIELEENRRKKSRSTTKHGNKIEEITIKE